MISENCAGFRFEAAVVGFGGSPTLWWMRFLKKGFYHCLVALEFQKQWLLIDPLIHYIDIVWIYQGDIHTYLKNHGYRLIDVKLEEPVDSRLHIQPFTCVETVKRVIGVQKRFIFTPFKLFCYLNKKNHKQLLTF